MVAARAVSAAVRPLPLFYGLSQAGRAVAALHRAHDWALVGHGLSFKPDPALQLLEQQVDIRSGRRDSFSGVASTLGVNVGRAAVELGALWSALPELLHPLPPIRRWPLAMQILPEQEPDPIRARMQGDIVFAAAGFPCPRPDGRGHSPAPTALPDHGHCPAGDNIRYGHRHVDRTRRSRLLPRLRWAVSEPSVHAHAAVLDAAAPEYGFRGSRYALPSVGSTVLPPLLLWWLLLYGLSIFARYEPATWRAALDVDNPGAAPARSRATATAHSWRTAAARHGAGARTRTTPRRGW